MTIKLIFSDMSTVYETRHNFNNHQKAMLKILLLCQWVTFIPRFIPQIQCIDRKQKNVNTQIVWCDYEMTPIECIQCRWLVEMEFKRTHIFMSLILIGFGHMRLVIMSKNTNPDIQKNCIHSGFIFAWSNEIENTILVLSVKMCRRVDAPMGLCMWLSFIIRPVTELCEAHVFSSLVILNCEKCDAFFLQNMISASILCILP